jgi:hypothetical protein
MSALAIETQKEMSLGCLAIRPCIRKKIFIRKEAALAQSSPSTISLHCSLIKVEATYSSSITLATTMKFSAFAVLSALSFASADRTFNITSALAKGQFEKYSCL